MQWLLRKRFKVSYLIGTVKAIELTEGSCSGDDWEMVPPGPPLLEGRYSKLHKGFTCEHQTPFSETKKGDPMTPQQGCDYLLSNNYNKFITANQRHQPLTGHPSRRSTHFILTQECVWTVFGIT